MRAVVLSEPGHAEVTYEPDPRPAAREVTGPGLCGTDVHMFDRALPPAPDPFVPGHGFVGRVVARSVEADGLDEGQAVAADCKRYTFQPALDLIAARSQDMDALRDEPMRPEGYAVAVQRVRAAAGMKSCLSPAMVSAGSRGRRRASGGVMGGRPVRGDGHGCA